MHCNGPFVPHQGTERHYICLLDRLRAASALRSEVRVDRRRVAPLRSQVDLLEAEIPGELLEEFGCGIETRHQHGGERTPFLRLLLHEAETCG